MNIFSALFQRMTGGRPIYITSGGVVSAFDRDAYEHELVRGIIDTIATHAAKSEAMHVVVDLDGRIKAIKRNSPYAKLLNSSPNAIMTGYDLKYRVFSQLEQFTTSFCYVRWNGLQPEMLLPVDYSQANIYPLEGGGYQFEFYGQDGDLIKLPLEDVIVLRKLFGKSEIMGDGNAPIKNTLDMIKASDDGLMQALSVSNKVRGILKNKKGMMSPDDKTRTANQFSTQFEAAAKKGGIVSVDTTEDYQQLQAQTLTVNALQMQEIKKNLLRYWHVSEPILTGDYTDSQYQAFFESVIESRLICAAQAFTNGFFTAREKGAGNRIIFNSSMLMHASVGTKINLLREARETGLFTVNEQRELFGYSPIEGGDERQVSLNFVKGTEQSKYQTGTDDPPEADDKTEGDGDG